MKNVGKVRTIKAAGRRIGTRRWTQQEKNARLFEESLGFPHTQMRPDGRYQHAITSN